MLKASSTVFLAFAPFSHFVYAASLRCSVIKQCVLERTHRQREKHKHPRERWCERQILWHPALSIYDSSINKWRPPPSRWKWAQRGQMPLSSGQSHDYVIQHNNYHIEVRKHYHPLRNITTGTVESAHWMMAWQLPYSVFWHRGFLFWLCNQHAYFGGEWAELNHSAFWELSVWLACLFFRAVRQDPACTKYPEHGTHRGAGKSRFLCLLLQMRVWGHLSECQLGGQIDSDSVSDRILKYHPMSRLLECIILRLLWLIKGISGPSQAWEQ